MRWILASLLGGIVTLHGCDVFAAPGSAVRTMESKRRIPEIVLQVIAGAVSDGLHGTDGRFSGLSGVGRFGFSGLKIDGEQREGFWAWCGAAYRVAGYAASDGSEVRRRGGSVEYSYQLTVRGYVVRRSTRIQDGHVLLTTSTGWVETVPIGRLTRRIPIRVTFTITALEIESGSVLRGLATGTADTGEFRCGIVRRIADQRASNELDSGLAEALGAIQREGIRYYQGAAELAPVLDEMRRAINFGRRIGR